MPKIRDTAIDALKGLLILLVVLAHNGGSHPFVFEFGHPARMGMFFMVSGYLLKGKLNLHRRLKGTFLPFIFFMIVSVLWRYLYGFISHEPLDFKTWGLELLYGKDFGLNIPIWFLLSYMEILMLVKLLMMSGSKVITWISAITLMIVGLVMMRYGINPLYSGRTLEYLPFFLLGGELSMLSHKFPRGGHPFITMLLIGILIWGRVNLPHMDYYVRWFTDSTLALILSYLIYNLFKNKHIPTKMLEFYGKNSIVVLCMHILILDIVWRLWWHLFGQPDMYGALLQTIIIALILYPCCIVYSKYIAPKLR